MTYRNDKAEGDQEGFAKESSNNEPSHLAHLKYSTQTMTNQVSPHALWKQRTMLNTGTAGNIASGKILGGDTGADDHVTAQHGACRNLRPLPHQRDARVQHPWQRRVEVVFLKSGLSLCPSPPPPRRPPTVAVLRPDPATATVAGSPAAGR